MRRFRWDTMLGLGVGLAVLAAAPGTAFGALEGPAWWVQYKLRAGASAHTPSPNELTVEPTAVNSTAISFVAYIKPIAGARTTHWTIAVGGEPECLNSHEPEEYGGCVRAEDNEVTSYVIASGEIVEGNPEAYVPVTASTENGGYFWWEFFFYPNEPRIPSRPPTPLTIGPGRVYSASASESAEAEVRNGNKDANIQVLTPGPLAPTRVLTQEAREAAAKRHKIWHRLKQEHPEYFQ